MFYRIKIWRDWEFGCEIWWHKDFPLSMTRAVVLFAWKSQPNHAAFLPPSVLPPSVLPFWRASASLILSRSDTAPLLSRGVASHVRLPGPLLPLVFRCMGADQQRSIRRGVSPCWLLRYGDWRLRRAGSSSLPVSAAAAAAAAVQPPTAESTTTAAADPTDPALPATAAPAVSATTGDWCRAGGLSVVRVPLPGWTQAFRQRDTICGLYLVQVTVMMHEPAAAEEPLYWEVSSKCSQAIFFAVFIHFSFMIYCSMLCGFQENGSWLSQSWLMIVEKVVFQNNMKDFSFIFSFLYYFSNWVEHSTQECFKGSVLKVFFLKAENQIQCL